MKTDFKAWWRSVRGGAALWIFAAILAALFVGALVKGHWVNVPCWDDWERGPFLKKVVEGEATFADYYAPHIQHRMVVPRALMVALLPFSDGDLRWEMTASWIFMLLAAILVAWLVRASLGQSAASLGVAFLLCLIVVHPIQYQNLLWAVQTAMMLPATAVLCGLVVLLHARWPLWVRWGVAALCALVATHSFSHGLMSWPVLLGALVLGRPEVGWRGKAATSAAWIALASVVVWFYFHELQTVSHPSHSYGWAAYSNGPQKIAAVIADPEGAFRFLRVLLGSFWARVMEGDPIAHANVIGLWVLVLFVVLSLVCLWLWRGDARFREISLPWMLIGSFGLLCCAAVVAGRMGILSTNRGISPRYISMSLYVSVAVLALVALLLIQLHEKFSEPGRRILRGASLLATGFLLALITFNWHHAAQLMDDHKAARYQAMARLAFIRFLPADHDIFSLDAAIDFPLSQAEFLNSRGWLREPLFDTADLRRFKRSPEAASSSVHKVTKIEVSGGDLLIEGEAGVPGTRRPADLVVFCRPGTDPPEVVAFADTRLPWGRPVNYLDHEFDYHQRPPNGRRQYWEARVRVDEVGDGLDTWILDARNWRAWRLTRRLTVPDAAGSGPG